MEDILTNVTSSQAHTIEVCNSLYDYLRHSFVADKFIDAKTDSVDYLSIALNSNLSWSQRERLAAHIQLIDRTGWTSNVVKMLQDKKLPQEVRLLVFALKATNHKFNYAQNKKAYRIFKTNVYKAITVLPLRLAYEIAITQLSNEVNDITRLKALFKRSDINYLAFSHAVNDWQNHFTGDVKVFKLFPRYSQASLFIKRMTRSRHYKLAYVFAAGITQTFPEIKNFNAFTTNMIKRLHNQWKEIEKETLTNFLDSVGLPTDPAELPFDWLSQLVNLPDLEALEPVGTWDGSR